jgi:hypothetical protein
MFTWSTGGRVLAISAWAISTICADSCDRVEITLPRLMPCSSWSKPSTSVPARSMRVWRTRWVRAAWAASSVISAFRMPAMAFWSKMRFW